MVKYTNGECRLKFTRDHHPPQIGPRPLPQLRILLLPRGDQHPDFCLHLWVPHGSLGLTPSNNSFYPFITQNHAEGCALGIHSF